MSEIDEKLIGEIFEILKSLEEVFEIKNEIDENLRGKFYEKVHRLPNYGDIIQEFEKVFSRDVSDNSQEILKRPKRDAKDFLPPPNIERKQTCVELFADFGSFFNKSISKFGFKYCSETEIVRRGEVVAMPKIEEERKKLTSGVKLD